MNKTHRPVYLLILMILILLMPTAHASAMLTRCRTDPIFTLSNGDKLTVTLDIDTDASYVRNVTYFLHIPAGVTVTKVTYTAGGLGTKETVKVYQDSPAKTYTTDTLLTTQNTGSITVIATTRLNSTYAQSVSGYNGQHLIATLIKP
jgi:hypothetical protein